MFVRIANRKNADQTASSEVYTMLLDLADCGSVHLLKFASNGNFYLLETTSI